MAHSNPFEDGNPWTPNTNGPRYGNAYDNDDRNAWTGGGGGGGTSTPTRVPSPSNYRTESNKIEYPSENDNAWDRTATPVTAPENAYQYSGTRFGANENYSGGGNAYTKTEISSTNVPAPAGGKPRPNQDQVEAALPPKWDDARMNPSKLRLLLRTLQFVAAIGHLGFAAGASPFSGEDIPLDNSACFYYLWAVAVVSIIWGFFHITFWCYRRIAHGNKLNRVLMGGTDLLLAILWGIGSIVEIAMYKCPPGGHNHWCDFYNVSIFWGMFSFALFVVAFGWDIVGACVGRGK